LFLFINTNPDDFDCNLTSGVSSTKSKFDSGLSGFVDRGGLTLNSIKLPLLLEIDCTIFDLFSSLFLLDDSVCFLGDEVGNCICTFFVIFGLSLIIN
jgi:hypothetical protein